MIIPMSTFGTALETVMLGAWSLQLAISVVEEHARLLVFVFTFGLSLVAVIGHQHRLVVTGYLLMLFAATTYFGAVRNSTVWPFPGLALFSEPAPADFTFHEFRVVDVNGKELRYDARAVAMTEPTPLNRLARDVLQYDEAHQHEVACFVLNQAKRYRGAISTPNGRLARLLRFPSHQLGRKWSAETLEGYSQLTEIRIYEINVRYDLDDGADERWRGTMRAEYSCL